MEIPPYLETQIREGKVVLLLGAGASRNAKDPKGQHPPTAPQLASMLSDKFLGGKYKHLPLNQIGEYAISETDLTTVQEYIHQVFEDFQPTQSHQTLCTFRWWGMATTNYDRIIERAYETTQRSVQKPQAFIENGDRVEDKLRDPQSLMLLKLHGCITRTSNASCPLILSTDQYIEHRKGRNRIFDHLKSWAFERTIIFIGHSLQDTDIRAILLELTSSSDTRPRYYMVVPDADDIQERFWETKKITMLKGTFDDFASSINSLIPSSFRGLSSPIDQKAQAIYQRFKVKDITLSSNCTQFLQADVDYVNDVTSTETVTPTEFYKGVSLGWSAIEQNLDVRRQLADTILADNFLIEESEHLRGLELIVLKAHAGAGKSVVLRRIAWDAARDYNCLCLYLRPYGAINISAIQEIINASKERVYLFIDDVADRVRDLQALAKTIGPEGKQLTIVAAERINEWNVSCESLSPYVYRSYELRYLNPKEIDGLLSLLAQHKTLGTLAQMNQEERINAFAELAGRQLLVALHEATLGRRFEDIIEDEYRNIHPVEAQQIYLSICVLNRLNVPVRAGIISRIHGVPFDDFKKRLFAPLEHVVHAEDNPIIRDHMYRARHPHIALIVFDRILKTQEERFDAYIKCLGELNVDYSSDMRAFRLMVRGRNVLDLFPNHELGKIIYKTARKVIGEDAHLLHQIALYEMNRPNGNLHEAGELLVKAGSLAPYDMSIKHSSSEYRLKCADTARTPLERDRLLKEAASIAHSLKSANTGEAHGHHTLVKVGIRRLRDVMAREEYAQPDFEIAVKDVERNLSDGLQRFPGDQHLLEAESQLAKLLSDSQRVLDSLKAAVEKNPRTVFIALRLAHCYRELGELEQAKAVIERALEANRGDKGLHFAYSMLLMKLGEMPGDKLAYHLQRSFAPGDGNYNAQLLYGRQLSLNGDREGYKKVFGELETARISAEIRNQLQYELNQRYQGNVTRLESSYLFIVRDGMSDWIYAHRNDINEKAWKTLEYGSRVSFQIAFTFRGANAFDIELMNNLN